MAVVSRFEWQRLSRAISEGELELFVDGRRVASDRTAAASPPPDDYLVPTQVGRDADGGARFSGRLGTPLFYNQQLVEDAAANPQFGNGLGAAGSEACAGLAN